MSLTIITNHPVWKSVENWANYGHLNCTCTIDANVMNGQAVLSKDGRRRNNVSPHWLSAAVSHLAFLYISMVYHSNAHKITMERSRMNHERFVHFLKLLCSRPRSYTPVPPLNSIQNVRSCDAIKTLPRQDNRTVNGEQDWLICTDLCCEMTWRFPHR